MGAAAASSIVNLGAARGAVGVDGVAEFDAEVAHAWFDLLRTLVKSTPGFSPPVASRAFGCAGVALYEALVPGAAGYRSLAGSLNGLATVPAIGLNQAYHWPTVANRVMAQSLRSLFPQKPASQGPIDALEQRFSDTFRASTPRGVVSRSVERGTNVAAAVDLWSREDGGHEAYLRNFPTSYTPPSGAGLWVPTAPGFQPALQPYWGTNRCFAMPSAGDCAPAAPIPFSTSPGSAFYQEALEVHDTVDNLTAEQRTIALYWSDDPGVTSTPPGHSVSILTQVLRSRSADLALAAEGYARLGIAVADAFIACWKTKFQYNLLRPVTYIRQVIDPAWADPTGPRPMPLNTPPFPEYTSGHSVQSGASAEVVTSMLGTVAFTDATHKDRGFASRTFPSFWAAAREAAVSRLYGGIHYRAAIERGLEQGRCIGQMVAALPMRA